MAARPWGEVRPLPASFLQGVGIEVGAVHKRTFATASFSSRGPTAFGADKPDLAAPGVNVRSSIPVPRTPSGQPVPNPARNLLSARMSGTSMSTPVVAGAAALAIQQRKRSNASWSPQDLRDDLLNRGCAPLQAAAFEVGAGRLSLRHF